MINEYYFDTLVIGGSLESLLHCFINDSSMVLLNDLYPLEVETVEYYKSLRLLGYSPDDIVYKSELWDRLAFVLSLTGKIILPNIVSSTRESDNCIVAITENNKRIRLHYEEIVTYDTVSEDDLYIIDWFDVRSGNNHNHSVLEDKNENFINKVFFYPSQRIGKNATMKDIFAVSHLHSKELEDANHSEGIARLKVLKMMRDAGIRGQSNGFSKNGKRQYFALKIEHTQRETRAKYTPLNNINYLLSKEPEKEDQWNITKKLFRHKQISTLQESFQLPANL